MKKILGMLGAIGLVATSSATVVSCGDPATDTTTYELLSGQAEAMKNALGELSHEDFKDVDKDNQYQQFFNMLPNSADDGVHVDSLDKMFYTPMSNSSSEKDDTTYTLLSEQVDNIKNYIEEGLSDFDVAKDLTFNDFFNYDNQDSSINQEFVTPVKNTWRAAENADDINAELLNWSKDQQKHKNNYLHTNQRLTL
jgi:hypothetical protein